jgi:ribose 5-phosphate isomerase B
MTKKEKEFAIGCDHAGYILKEIIKKHIENKKLTFTDFGTYSEERVDYPDYAHPVAQAVEDGLCKFGILICGSGNGVCITANKHQGIRAALCWNAEISTMARKHNDANIICLPARYISYREAIEIMDAFIDTEFEGGRHEQRIEKIPL